MYYAVYSFFLLILSGCEKVSQSKISEENIIQSSIAITNLLHGFHEVRYSEVLLHFIFYLNSIRP